MRVNEERKTMDIEQRDVDYILPAYVRLYLFQTRNQEPEKIVFPMFRSVPHPYKKGVQVPIEYIPDTSPIAVEIAEDGKDIKSGTPESEAAADKKEKDYDANKKRIAELEAEVAALRGENPTDQEVPATSSGETVAISPARAAFAEQEKTEPEPEKAIAGVDEKLQPSPERVAKAKQPDKPLPPGTATDYGGRRDAADQRRVARDLAPEKDISEEDEAKEKSDDELVRRVKGKKKEA